MLTTHRTNTTNETLYLQTLPLPIGAAGGGVAEGAVLLSKQRPGSPEDTKHLIVLLKHL
jgi:hypothetical protein